METQSDLSHRRKLKDQIHDLPKEIIEEICLRLPVKSLLKFKAVSKSWCSLISSKDFARAHLDLSSRRRSSTHHRIIATSVNLKQFSLESLLYKPLTCAVDFDYPLYESDDAFNVVGCCNGLVCILIGYKGLILWNPSTKQYKELPSISHTMPDNSMFMYGLGYDESGDDHKVFVVLPLSQVSAPGHGVASVYSLKWGSWKKVENFTTNLPVHSGGKLASYNLHWIRNNDAKWEILSFDLVREAFGSVDLPCSIDDHYHPSLNELKGCLILICEYALSRLDVWMLRQYGVKESWDKLVSITYPCFPNPSYPCYGPFMGPFCVGDNGEFLFVLFDKKFALYYPREAWFSRPMVLNLDYVKKVDVYVESLVSPFA